MRPGTILAERYTLDDELGSGTIGDVWLGHDTVLDRPVTIKVLNRRLAANESKRARFRRVALEIASLSVPGIVDVHDCFEEPDTDGGMIVCHVTERVPGRSLRQLLDERRTLSADETLPLITTTARALHGAHEANVVHGELKPENLIVGPGGGVTVVDFGFLPADAGDRPRPYAPERGGNGRGADVYALAAIAYECLTGRIPDADRHPLPESIDPEYAAPIMRALAHQPKRRFSSAAAFADACEHATGQPPAEPGAAPNVTLRPPIGTSEPATDEPAAEPAVSAQAADHATQPDPGQPAPATSSARPAETTPDRADDTGDESEPDSTDAAGAGTPPAGSNEAEDAQHAAEAGADGTPPRGSGRSRVMIVVALLAVLIVSAVGMHLIRPGEPAGHVAGDASTSGTTDGSGSSSPSPSASEVEVTLNSAQPAPTTTSPTPSGTTTSDDDSVTVPGVVGKPREIAAAELRIAGFAVDVAGFGDGRHECPVESQDPRAGSSAPAGSTVTIGVRRVHSPPQCPD